MLDKFRDASHAEPARHRARDFVTDQITEHGRIADISPGCVPHHPCNFVAYFLLPQKFDVLFPRQRDQNSHSSRETFFQEPFRRRMINPQHVQTDLAHHPKIDIHLLRPTESVSFLVRFKRAVGRAFDEELAIAFEKEFRSSANPLVCWIRHSERSASRTTVAVFSMSDHARPASTRLIDALRSVAITLAPVSPPTTELQTNAVGTAAASLSAGCCGAAPITRKINSVLRVGR